MPLNGDLNVRRSVDGYIGICKQTLNSEIRRLTHEYIVLKQFKKKIYHHSPRNGLRAFRAVNVFVRKSFSETRCENLIKYSWETIKLKKKHK